MTGPPGAGKSTLLSALLHAWRSPPRRSGRQERGDARGGPELEALGRLAAGRPRAHRVRPGRQRRADPLDRRGRATRRPRPRHPRGGASAGGGVRRGRDRDGGRGTGRDRGGGRRRHGRGGRAARQRRRIAVPEVGNHGDSRRARRHQGRPRPDRACHQARPERGAALARRPRTTPHACWRSPRCLRPRESTSWWGRWTSIARALDVAGRRLRARRAGALLDFTAEHGERGLRALGGRRAAERLLEQQDPGLDARRS